jgi:hypothetical protein
VTGALFVLWHRLHPEQRKNLWPFYGRFTFAAFFASSCGILVMFVRVTSYLNHTLLSQQVDVLNAENWRSMPEEYQNLNLARICDLRADQFFHFMWFAIPEGLQLCALMWVNLAVLERVAHAAVASSRGMPVRWVIAKRIAQGIISALLLTALAARVAARIYAQQLRGDFSAIAREFRSGNPVRAFAIWNDSSEGKTQRQFEALHGVFDVSESACLVFVVATFLAVAALCAGRVARILRQPAPPAADSSIRNQNDMKTIMRQIIITCAVVFLSLVCRAVVSILWAYVMIDLSDGSDHSCAVELVPDPCNPCHDVAFLMFQWMRNTPELTILGYDFPSPVALLIAVWGMTSQRLLVTLKQPRKHAADDADVAARHAGNDHVHMIATPGTVDEAQKDAP